jgi:WD40 repeat protein
LYKCDHSYLNNNKLILSGSSDKTVIVWNSETFKYIKTLEIFNETVLSLANLNTFLAVGLKNNEILIYEQIYRNKVTLYDSTGIYALASLPNSNIVSGSWDGTIKIWQSYECIATFI